MLQDTRILWKHLHNTKQATAVHVIQNSILRAMASKNEDKITTAKCILRKAFSPVTNQTKLNNGVTPFHAIMQQWHGYKLNNAHVKVVRKGQWLAKDQWGPDVVTYRPLLGQDVKTILTDEEIDQYEEIYAAVLKDGIARWYSYFFTRQDIFDEYQLVQTAHVALELGNKLPAESVKNLHFTVCGVPDLEALHDVEKLLKSWNAPHVTFREPDIGNQLTSIGVYPLEETKRGVLKNYKLLRFNNDRSRS